MIKGIEFFSGVGAWQIAMPNVDFTAFEINLIANKVYLDNHEKKPIVKNLASIKSKDVPDATIWCLSPPCQPFTSQKSKKMTNTLSNDLTNDPRNDALSNIISLVPLKRPKVILLENVANFQSSELCLRLKTTLTKCDYNFKEIVLCPTELGIPNSRKRYFLVAIVKTDIEILAPIPVPIVPLSHYINEDCDNEFYLSKDIINKYFMVSDIRQSTDTSSNCFTKNYHTYIEGTGSLLQTKSLNSIPSIDNKHNLGLRRFTPKEISSIFGFPDDFIWNISVKNQYKLIGNSINIHCIQHIVSQINKYIY